MARELPIHNGRLTTDLDADGHSIVNLPGGGTDTISWENVTDKPSFATVATSGSYNDLSDKPTIPAPVDVSGKADKSEMLVTPGTGADADKTTIQLKSGTSATVLTAHQDISGKANASDVNAALAQKADADALPYALVMPGEWELHSESYDVSTLDSPTWYSDPGYWWIENESLTAEGATATDPNALSLVFMDGTITATRPSLPGHLCDRANNLVTVSANTTLTLPEYVEGKVRDLLVHVNLGDDGTNPYTVTVNFPTGESGTGFKVKGNASAPLPAPDAAGEWLYSFSESSPHKMAVSLAQLQDATTAGGS